MTGSPAVPNSARRCFAAGALLLALLAAPLARAHGASPEMLKAEVLYRVLMFVTWPAEREAPGRPLQLCTADDSGRMEAALQTLAGRVIRQLAIEVRRTAGPEQLGRCHLLYLPGPQPAWRAPLAELPVLVVSDAAAMLDQGAMVNLQVEDGRIVFDVDLDASRRAGLTISTKLLRLARFVRHHAASP